MHRLESSRRGLSASQSRVLARAAGGQSSEWGPGLLTEAPAVLSTGVFTI